MFHRLCRAGVMSDAAFHCVAIAVSTLVLIYGHWNSCIRYIIPWCWRQRPFQNIQNLFQTGLVNLRMIHQYWKFILC